jgi:hypothetical protein
MPTFGVGGEPVLEPWPDTMATDGGSFPRWIWRQPGVGTVRYRMIGNRNGIVVLVASWRTALTSGNVNAVTADILTGEGMVYSRASILIEAKMTARQEREENRRGELLCVL